MEVGCIICHKKPKLEDSIKRLTGVMKPGAWSLTGAMKPGAWSLGHGA